MISRFTRSGIAALALLAGSFAAEAADMPVRAYPPEGVVAYYNWTGFYAGVNAGYSWGSSDLDFPLVVKPQGWMAGGTIGYNFQFGGPWVWGFEGDIAWADVSASADCGGFSCGIKQTWFATARGRAGYAFDRWLPYVTGGVAFGNVQTSSGNPALLGISEALTGWTVGAGLEYAFLGNWTAKVEYLYADLGKLDCGSNCGTVVGATSFTQNIIRAGINYRFSGPVFTRY